MFSIIAQTREFWMKTAIFHALIFAKGFYEALHMKSMSLMKSLCKKCETGKNMKLTESVDPGVSRDGVGYTTL